MPYGEIVRVRAPVEAYHAMHSAIGDLLGSTDPEGVSLHVARATASTFEVYDSEQAQ